MKANSVYVLSRDPLVVAGGFNTLDQLPATRQPFTFLYHNVGWLRPHRIPRYLRAKRRSESTWRLIVVTNEPSEARWLRLVGVEAHALSSSIFVRDNFFRPHGGSVKQYDAVYAAQLEPFKRLSLASHVRSLCVVTYKNGEKE